MVNMFVEHKAKAIINKCGLDDRCSEQAAGSGTVYSQPLYKQDTHLIQTWHNPRVREEAPQGPRRVGPQARAGPRNGPSEGGRRGAAVGVVANEENIRQPQKAGSLCDMGTGVNIPVVPSREERCPAAGEGTAAAGTKTSGGRSGIPGRKEPWTGERPDGAMSESRRRGEP
ncbi:hypothetical protein NQZ68_007093 [Dissostichus eleginoides]|nr:hypothetical protein NQZ68_007093 [Dissostichus eleginoides]